MKITMLLNGTELVNVRAFHRVFERARKIQQIKNLNSSARRKKVSEYVLTIKIIKKFVE